MNNKPPKTPEQATSDFLEYTGLLSAMKKSFTEAHKELLEIAKKNKEDDE